MIIPENVIFGPKIDFLEIGPGVRPEGRGVRKTRFHLILSSFSPLFGPLLALKYVQKGLFKHLKHPQEGLKT